MATLAPESGASTHLEEDLRLARADVARLKLELRSVTRKADDAEQLLAAAEPVADEAAGFDAAAARELLVATLRPHLEARRAELAAELEEARAEASRLLQSAHQRAEEYVAGAHDVVFSALLRPGEEIGPLPPLPLEIVTDTRPSSTPEAVAEARPSSASEVVPEQAVPVAEPADGTHGVGAMLGALQAYLAHAAGAAPAAAAAFTTARRPRQPREPLRTRLLHADVVLPLIAVVAVLLILIAWVG